MSRDLRSWDEIYDEETLKLMEVKNWVQYWEGCEPHQEEMDNLADEIFNCLRKALRLMSIYQTGYVENDLDGASPPASEEI